MATTVAAQETPKLRQLPPGWAIPSPADFPVTWQNPADARLFWTREQMHYPVAMPPLAFQLVCNMYLHGYNMATAFYEMPIRFDLRRLNTYVYQTVVPVGLPPEPVLKALRMLGHVVPGMVSAIQGKAVGGATRKYLEKLNPAIERLDDYWKSEVLPEVKQHLAIWEQFDLDRATPAQLLEHLDHSLASSQRDGELHFLITFPYLLAVSQFDELYHELFGKEGAFAAYQLLEGFDNKILAGDHALWALSRQALTLPAVRRTLEERASHEVISELEKTAEGQAFLAELRAFLAEYGQRGDTYDSFSTPSWIEDPTPVIKNLKDYITQPDRDPAVELKALAAEREQLVAQARERLKGYPRPVAAQFELLLKAAQQGMWLHSEHQFWLDYRCQYQVRRVVLEFGRRLVSAGVIERQDDVFYLELDELKAAARALASGDGAVAAPAIINRHQIVRERKQAAAHFGLIQPPPALGTMPLAEPPDDPIVRTVNKFFGTPVQLAAEPGVLNGHAGSPGKARGIARVVRSLSESGKLQPGDVLVAETTAPPWTPLFATVAAVVTDTGGILSHCAVVAREYHIPAVVGTGAATTKFQDGQLLEVDGSAGTVRVIASV